jgi:CHAT domain
LNQTISRLPSAQIAILQQQQNSRASATNSQPNSLLMVEHSQGKSALKYTEIEAAAISQFYLTSCTILKNGQDARSTRDEFDCGTGILPVHKELIENRDEFDCGTGILPVHKGLIENGATYEINQTQRPSNATTKTAIIQALKTHSGIFHYTGHAYHNTEKSENSALLLAEGEELTLTDILQINFINYYLICLSFYLGWLDLLCFRHKIIWAYENSLELKERLVMNYNQIVGMRNTSRLTLSKLLEAMGKLSEFAIDLNYLELQSSTIKVNLEKYKTKLAEIQAKARPTDDLQFLQDFWDKAEKTYPKQIQKDIDNFRPCLEILRSLTDTIRGTVEIRKAESDRTFQTIVGIVGVGLSTGGTVASAAAGFKPEIAANLTINSAINTFVPIFAPGSGLRIILGFSILSGVTASLLTAIIIGVCSRISRR